MDVTHVSSFGKLSFVHVTVDTFSHIIITGSREKCGPKYSHEGGPLAGP